MKAIRILAFAVLIGGVGAAASLAAQAPAPPPAEPAPRGGRGAVVVPAPVVEPTSVEQADAGPWRERPRPVIRFWQPYQLKAGEQAGDIVVISGDATIEGHVAGDVVVVGGNLRFGSSAVTDGDVVAVAGTMTVDPGASVAGDVVLVGGSLNAPAAFSPRGQQIVVGPPGLGDALRSVVPWVTHGLMWGRLVVPSVGWVWWFLLAFFLIYAAMAAAFPRAIHACVDTLATRPVNAFFAGILVLVLFGPVCTILAMSIVGIPVIPFASCAMLVGWMLGKAALMRWIGGGILHEESPDHRLHAMRSLAIGFVVLTTAYAIPILGIAAWAIVGVFGLGTATMTALGALRRERPASKPKSAPPPSAPPLPVAFAAPVEADRPLHPGEPPASAQFAPTAGPSFANGPGVAASVDLRSLPRATFLDRVAAGTLDAALVWIAVYLLGWTRYDGAFFMVLVAYHIAFWAWKGTTVGSIVCNLRIIRTDGTAVQPVDAVVRGLSSLFSAAALGIGFFWIALDSNREKQAWHDKIAGTLVVRVPRDWPLP